MLPPAAHQDCRSCNHVAKRCDPGGGGAGIGPRTCQIGANTIVAPLFIGAYPPYRAVMEILTQRDHVDGEMPRRGRALQAAPPLLSSIDSQILRRQRVSPAYHKNLRTVGPLYEANV